jgi:hypothetical protein
MDASIRESEMSLAQLIEPTDRGIAEASAVAERVNAQQRAGRASLEEVVGQIESESGRRIQRLNAQVDEATRRTTQAVAELKERISVLLEDRLGEQEFEPDLDFVDELEVIENETELEKVLVRLDDLRRRLQEAQAAACGGQEEEQETVEVFTRMEDGKEVKYYCLPDGTFHL